MNIDTLLDRALQNGPDQSQNQLSRRIGIASPSVTNWRRGFAIPTDKYVISLCKLAKVQPEIGLLWAAAWRSKGEAVSRWERMAHEAETRFGFTLEEEEAA